MVFKCFMQYSDTLVKISANGFPVDSTSLLFWKISSTEWKPNLPNVSLQACSNITKRILLHFPYCFLG